MAGLIARKLGQSFAVLFIVVTATFFLIRLAPGNPFNAAIDAANISPRAIEQLRRNFGLDRPLLVQYASFLADVATGDLGTSFDENRPVVDAIGDRIGNTMILAGAALMLDFIIGIAIGVWQAWRRGRADDRLLTVLTLALHSTPVFWLGLMLMLVFAVELRVLPVNGATSVGIYDSLSPLGQLWDRLRHLVLPATTLALIGAGGTARFQRAALIEALSLDHVRTARAKGLSEWVVLLKHGLRNSLLPIITLFGLSFPVLLSGSVLIERVYGWPGMGMLATDAILARDYPVVIGIAIVATAMVIVGNLLADVLYRVVDPRTRES